ncbi:MAG: hypothetical protein QOE73_1090 [Verrucomicrobiota bacterium]|jgi:parallel beta-helix repeat protein
MFHKFWLTNIAAVAALVLCAGPVSASIITVTSGADSGAGTLRQAISDASAGDTINFARGLTTISLTSAELLIDKNLTISGPGANLLSVQRDASASANFRIFNIAGNFHVTISGLTIANGHFSDPYSTGQDGCGIANGGGTLTLTNVTISGNTGTGPSDGAGGLFNAASGVVILTNSTISGNSAEAGGGIFNYGTLTVTSSTISDNMAITGGFGGGDGGGIWNYGGTVTLTNSTVSNNTADFSGGGGIYNYGSGTVTLTDSTISGNKAQATGGGPVGGGIANISGSTVNARNTIIAKNTADSGPDIYGTLTSQGYNLIGNTSGMTLTGTTTGNQLNVDPVLGPLHDNGGPTFTQALLSGSPAIEAGNSSGSNTDQRGFARPVDDPVIANASGGDGSDIGAYEVQADQLPGCKNINSVVSNTNDSGAASLRDVIGNVCAGVSITFAPSVRGAINLTSGELALNKGLQISGPGANLLSVQRSAAAGNFRIFHITGNYSVAISGLTIANGNATANLGGGISNDNGALTLTNATVSGNTADIGAGIYTARAMSIFNSTISGNIVSGNLAGDGGGGIYNQGGTVSLTNSTISGNMAHIANGGAQGGAIRNNLGTATLINTTIASNSADFGGGIYNSNSGTVNAFNTIIALNTSPSGPDVNGPLTSQGFNLIGNASGATISPAQFSDQIGVSAAQLNLGPLQDNGGTTFTHALLSGSFAIDKGNSGGSVVDERGFSRPHDDPNIANASDGDGSDIGAFEFGSTPLLRIISITHMANGHILLQCLGVSNAVNDLQVSPDLSANSFTPISPPPAAADGTGAFQYDDAGAVGLAKRFYRLSFP